MRDTTTPDAMLGDLRALLLGDELSAASRDQLATWTSSTFSSSAVHAGMEALRQGGTAADAAATAALTQIAVPETVRLVGGLLLNRLGLSELLAAPPLLLNTSSPEGGQRLTEMSEWVPAGAYGPKMLQDLDAEGIRPEELPLQKTIASGNRGNRDHRRAW